MAFESLSERYTLELHNFPVEWLPLTHLYDPDLPLFPLIYIHALDPGLVTGVRPGERDRVYGFVQHIGLRDGRLVASLVLNKNLTDSQNARYVPVVKDQVANRFGLGNPITVQHIQSALAGTLSSANSVLLELWHAIIDPAFGGCLPFGRMWDEVFGLVRFIASWNSQGGRKGELIQTHYFLSAFGEKIATSSGISASFYLLPTFAELQDTHNPLSIFPKFRDFLTAASDFVSSYCNTRTVGSFKFSGFRINATGLSGQLNTEKILQVINRTSGVARHALFENYNAFNRGPPRSVLSLLMWHDLRNNYWDPRTFTPSSCASIYESLEGSYQSPKVIQLYAQQCFGSECSLPIDNWVRTFVQWPLHFTPSAHYYAELFSTSALWGRLERLIWVAAQARKVHASVAAEILWCIRYGESEHNKMRGSGPFSCKICDPTIRSVCPSYAAVATDSVSFNENGATFRIDTSAGDITTLGQSFKSCSSAICYDEYSPRDRPAAFLPFPQAGQTDAPMTVAEFITRY